MNLIKNQIVQKLSKFWKKELQGKRLIFQTINGFKMLILDAGNMCK